MILSRSSKPDPLAWNCVSVRRVALVVAATVVLITSVGTASASASPRWQLGSESAPSNLAPDATGEIIMVASNLGDEPVEGNPHAVIITDKLPAGVTPTSVERIVVNGVQVECSIASVVTCRYTGVLYPYEQITIPIQVKVEEPPGTVARLDEEESVEGGGAANITRTPSLIVSGEPAPFGIAAFELTPFNEDGTPATLAGAHPFQLTTEIAFNQTAGRMPVALPRDLHLNPPPGLVGNPNAAAQCNMTDFTAVADETNLCPVGSVVGVATVTANEPKFAHVFSRTVPVFNLVPEQGEPARFGFEVLGKVPIVIDTSVRSGSDYGVIVSVKDATQTAGLLTSQVTLWGVPGDPRHNNVRGWECVAGGYYTGQIKKPCPASSTEPEEPLLTMPTSCPLTPEREPFMSSMEADSWSAPGQFSGAEYTWLSTTGRGLSVEGCDQLPFTPEIDVTSEQHSASTPTGLAVDVRVPQQLTLEADGLAEADVRDTTVTLPPGVQLSPSAANGLEGCSEAQIGFNGFNQKNETDEFTPTKAGCPDGAKVGSVRIKTPLLSHELEGWVYLAAPAPNGQPGENPFNSLIALYIVAEDPVSGVLVKLAGEGHIDEGTLQISTTFRNTPQVPFEDLKLDLFGGPRSSISTPPACGSYATNALFTPWSGTETLNLSSPSGHFAITSGVNGSACPGAIPFSPGFLAQTSSTQAGAFTGFALELARPDGDQALSAVSMHLPPGIAARLSSVELCNEAQANAGACPASSEVGEATALAGLGPEPYAESGGRVFITGPYRGAPFGLEIVTPAKAGPFDLGYVTVRSRLYIDPTDASVTIVSDPLPTQLRGIPLQLKRVLVSVNRPDFEFNPTNCSPMKIEGTVEGAEGASAGVSSPFQVADCQSLPFAPKLTAATDGHASKADGTNFIVDVESGGVGAAGVAQAGVAKVNLQLPKTLPARLSTLQKACTESAFNANPASCPEGSDIGTATIHTPVLKSPLSGPAYLVSHGNATFPDVEFVLQDEGITLVLDGKTQIKDGITYSKFESAPDAPFTRFETVLPAGPHSALTVDVAEKEEIRSVWGKPCDADHDRRPERRRDRAEDQDHGARLRGGQGRQSQTAHQRTEARQSSRRLPQALQTRPRRARGMRTARTPPLPTCQDGAQAHARR